MKTKDKTVVHNLGLEACGGGANMLPPMCSMANWCVYAPCGSMETTRRRS